MPFINTKTNISVTKEQEWELKTELGAAIANLGKTENWLMISFDENRPMYFKGDSSAPMAYVEISVFGTAAKEQCEKMTRAVCGIYGKILNIASDKIYVKYEFSSHWGWNNMMF